MRKNLVILFHHESGRHVYRAKLDRLGQFCYQHMVRKITELSELEEVLNWLKAIQIQLRQCPQI